MSLLYHSNIIREIKMKNEPHLSILIPVKNNVKLTRQCIESILCTIPNHVQYEVLIQDNGSTDSTPEYLKSLDNQIRMIPGNASNTFAMSNNEMAKNAQGQVLCLLNNDTLLLDGWIEPMLELIDREPMAGMIGNVQLFPNDSKPRRINHAGVVFDDNRLPTHLYEGLHENLGAATKERELQAVTAACAMIRKDLYMQLQGLDETFRNGHEDIDLCLRAKKKGYSNWVVGKSRIIHYGSSTPGRMAYNCDNTRLFLARHFDSIESDLCKIVKNDGINWPTRKRMYRVARTLWRCPPTQLLLQHLLKTRLGVRMYQATFRYLSHSTP